MTLLLVTAPLLLLLTAVPNKCLETDKAFVLAGTSGGLVYVPIEPEPPRPLRIFNSTNQPVIAVDSVYKDDELFVYWSTIRSIQKGKLSFIDGRPVISDWELLVNTYLESVEGLRIDWINDNLYWVESKKKHIEVSRLDGSMRTSLVGPLGRPRGLALDPRSDVLFWSDWNERQPCIERSSLAGKKRRIIVNVTDYHGGLPNGLTLDLATKRIFWIDALSKAIHSTTYEGTEHRNEMSIKDQSHRPFSLDILHTQDGQHNEVIFWTDFGTGKLYKGTKTHFWLKLERIFHATVVHPSKKPNDVVKGPCKKNNGGCSHLCSTSCLCPYGKIHDPANARTCIPHRDTFMYATKVDEMRSRIYVTDTKLKTFIFPPLKLNVSLPSAVFDSGHDRLFWIEGKIVMAHYLTNASTEKFLNFGSRVRLTALTLDSHNIYVSSSMQLNSVLRHEVSACSLINKMCTNLAGDRMGHVVSLAVDKGKLFWIEKERLGYDRDMISVKRSSLNGTNELLLYSMDIHKSHQIRGRELKLQVMDDSVCFADAYNATIYCIKHTSGAASNDSVITKHITLGAKKEGVEFAVTPDRRSISYSKGSALYMAGEQEPRNVTDTVVSMGYFTKEHSHRGRQDDCTCPQGICVSGRCIPSGGSDTLLYFLQGHRVAAYPLTQNLSLAPMVIHAELGEKNLDSLHVANNGHIYSTFGPDLFESRLDGLSLRHLHRLQPVAAKVTAIASDLLAGKLYLATCCTIYSINLDGTDLQYVVNGTFRVTGLAVHPVRKYLFWSDAGGYTPRIERIHIQDPKSTRTVVVQNDLIRLSGITVDGEHLYWCDIGTAMIGKSDLNGKQKSIVVQRSGNWHFSPVSVAVYHSVVFWIDSTYSGGALMFLQRGGRPTPSTWSRYLGPNVSHLQLYDKSILQGFNNSAVLEDKERLTVFDPVISCQGFCLNGGTCELPPSDAPLVIGVGAQCVCPANYTGHRCQYLASYLYDPPVLHRDDGIDLKVILLPISVGAILIPFLCLLSWWRTRRVWRETMQSRCSLSSNRDNNMESLPIDAQYETSFAQDADNILLMPTSCRYKAKCIYPHCITKCSVKKGAQCVMDTLRRSSDDDIF